MEERLILLLLISRSLFLIFQLRVHLLLLVKKKIILLLRVLLIPLLISFQAIKVLGVMLGLSMNLQVHLPKELLRD
jgi:hypothetical protein